MEGILSRDEFADRTVPSYILQYLATELAEEWQTLARCLNISEVELYKIKANHSGRMQDMKRLMLRHWTARNGAGATYRVLVKALDKAGRRDLREYVERQANKIVEQQEEKGSDVPSKGKAPDPSSVKQPSTSASDRVVTDATIQDLSIRISREWKDLGRNLRLMEVELENLQINCTNHYETAYQMLLTWKARNGMKATYRVLGEALRKAGRVDLQEMLYKQAVEQQEDKSGDVSSKGKVSYLQDLSVRISREWKDFGRKLRLMEVERISPSTKKQQQANETVEQQEDKSSDVSSKGKDGVEDSAASSYDKLVDAGLSQSQKRTGDKNQTAKQPLENIDLVVRTESLRDFSGKIPREWKNVGRILGLQKSNLKYLERDNINQGYKETVYQMLLTWKQSRGMNATYRVLGEALEASGHRDLQEMLYKQAEQQEDKGSNVSSEGKPPDVLPLLHESLQKVFAEMTRSDSENLANFFMFPLKHVKAIVNSPSHSKDLLVELENKGIIQSALTDELFENLRALNVLTGRSEGSKSSIYRPSSTFLKHEEDWKPPDTMKITSPISGKGGLLQIPNTGIKLVFPPNAVTEEHNIQVKIIPPSLLNEPATSFSSNSSVVLQLLPNGLQLKREVSLTLPHCLTFANEEKAKAKVYVSHHEEGQKPRWEERPLSPYIFHRSKCTVRLLGFCWLKVIIDDTEVEAKNLVIFAAKKILQNKKTAKVEVGYYENIPERGEPNILKWNQDMKPERRFHLTFLKEGKQPLTISFNGTDPGDTWFTEQRKAKKEIPWLSIALSEERVEPFVLHRKQNMDSFCNFTAQQGDHNPITFEIEMGGNQSSGEFADSTVPDCILEHLARELTSEWKMLARYLNMSNGDLYNIHENNPRCEKSAKYFMLHQWRRRNGAGATCSVLATALDKANRRDLREYVERQDPGINQ